MGRPQIGESVRDNDVRVGDVVFYESFYGNALLTIVEERATVSSAKLPLVFVLWADGQGHFDVGKTHVWDMGIGFEARRVA